MFKLKIRLEDGSVVQLPDDPTFSSVQPARSYVWALLQTFPAIATVQIVPA
jgi:hypothetical protein